MEVERRAGATRGGVPGLRERTVSEQKGNLAQRHKQQDTPHLLRAALPADREKKTPQADWQRPAPGAWDDRLAIPDAHVHGVSGSQAPDEPE